MPEDKTEATIDTQNKEEWTLKDNPLEELELEIMTALVKRLYDEHFAGQSSATEEELQVGVRLARRHGSHQLDEEEANEDDERPAYTPSIDSRGVIDLLEPRERRAIEIQQSKQFWMEPKDLLITILACCMASMTQGWDQAANGNLGWPNGLGVSIEPNQSRGDVWTFGAVNAITWFSAAVLGPFLVDPICYSRFFGRRGSVFIAAAFSFAATIGGSRATTWEGYLIARLFLGIGIGAKASIVPIWESEILPPNKRGRILVSWQVFTAIGIFAGSVATYIFRTNWRNQVLSGAIPALILLILTYLCCESPRWLIIQGNYIKAFDTLVRLRKERRLAAEEFVYIYYQIQTERYYQRQDKKKSKQKPDLNHFIGHIGYGERLPKIVTIDRNRRAAVATMIVMLSQQLSGINILAFLASIFFTAANLTTTSDPDEGIKRNLGLSMGFGAANAIFSAVAYFWIEPLPLNASMDELYPSGSTPLQPVSKKKEESLEKMQRLLYGRRRLLLQSLASGTVMLFILTFLLRLPEDNPNKLGAVTAFVFIFTMCYSPGAGAVPFLYSAEVWPNEGREVGMSWGVFWNFLGSGFLALFVPRGLAWGSDKLFGVFTGFSFLGFLLVYFLVPSTGNATSLEDMSRRFDVRLRDHGKKKLKHLQHIKNISKWMPFVSQRQTGKYGGNTNLKTTDPALEGVQKSDQSEPVS